VSEKSPAMALKKREKHLRKLMMAMAEKHDEIVSEREQGAASALRCANGMATEYWREIAKTARRCLEKERQL